MIKAFVHYISGGILVTIPNELVFTYALHVLKYWVASFILSYYFNTDVPYILTFAIAWLIADFKFHNDFIDYILYVSNSYEDEDDF